MSNDNYIDLGDKGYNKIWLKSVSLAKALKVLSKKTGHEENQVRNAWKQARGLSVRNDKMKAKKPKEKVVKKVESKEDSTD